MGTLGCVGLGSLLGSVLRAVYGSLAVVWWSKSRRMDARLARAIFGERENSCSSTHPTLIHASLFATKRLRVLPAPVPENSETRVQGPHAGRRPARYCSCPARRPYTARGPAPLPASKLTRAKSAASRDWTRWRWDKRGCRGQAPGRQTGRGDASQCHRLSAADRTLRHAVDVPAERRHRCEPACCAAPPASARPALAPGRWHSACCAAGCTK